MPIEDVDYLKSHSKRENYVFFVDSKRRNRLIDPHPGNYRLTFSTPISNVYGIEVLDAAIPRTMYNVDEGYNNTLSFFIYDSTFDFTRSKPNFTTVSIPGGDYNIVTFLNTLTPLLSARVNGDSTMPIGRLTVSPTSNPPEKTNTLYFTSSYSFMLDMRSSLAETLGFDELADPLETTNYVKPQRTAFMPSTWTLGDPRMVLETITYNQLLETTFSTDTPMLFSNQVTRSYPTLNSPASSLTYQQLLERNETIELLKEQCVANQSMWDNDSLYQSIYQGGEAQVVLQGPVSSTQTLQSNTWIAQPFYSTVSGSFGSFTLQIDNADGAADEIAWGVTTTPSIPDNPSVQSFPSRPVGLSSTITLLSQNVISITAYRVYWLVIRTKSSAPLLGQLAITTVSATVASAQSASVNGQNVITIVGQSARQLQGGVWSVVSSNNNQMITALCCQVTVLLNLYNVHAPGIFNLQGERYILLRCPEIESHMYRSLVSDENNMGICKFRMGAMGMIDSRNDFFNAPAREFHPIARLKSITFKFETPIGTLYNFRGCNHTLTVAIKYFEPVQQEVFTRSTLVPNYNGNINAFVRHEDDMEAIGLETGQDHLDGHNGLLVDSMRNSRLQDDDDDLLKTFRQNEARFQPSQPSQPSQQTRR